MCNCHKIFVVDDDASGRDSVQWLLESHSHQVMSYSSAEEFIKGLDENVGNCCFAEPANACLVLDLKMPGMDGLTLQQLLRKRCPCLPVIFVSGHANEQQIAQAMMEGAVAFLDKPFNDEVLLTHIQRALTE